MLQIQEGPRHYLDPECERCALTYDYTPLTFCLHKIYPHHSFHLTTNIRTLFGLYAAATSLRKILKEKKMKNEEEQEKYEEEQDRSERQWYNRPGIR